MSKARAAAILCIVLLIAHKGSGATTGEDRDVKFLLDGVNRIAAPGVPGPLCVFGDDAFAVVTGTAGEKFAEPVVAAARMGKGRAVVFGHDGYFAPDALGTGDTLRLLENALRWAAGGAKSEPQVGVYKQPALLAFLQKKEIRAAGIDELGQGPSRFNVLCVQAAALSTPQEVEAVGDFVRKGGGLVTASLGWGWLQLHPGMDLRTDHPGNRLLAAAGIVWADGCLGRTCDAGYTAGKPPSKFVHAARAFDALKSHAPLGKDDLAQAAWVVTHAARSLPPSDKLLLPRLRKLQKEYAAEAIPTPEKPLKADQPLARLALTLQLEEMKGLKPEQVRAHPAAASFPGAVPAGAEKVIRSIEVDTKVPGWHSTGLYAPPGKVIEVRAPATAAGKKLMVRIGAHSDVLWGLDSWKRCPEISRHDPIDGPVTKTASAFGGPIYIEVPAKCALGEMRVEISGGIEAPYYILGKTDPAQWRLSIRNRPAPWAELAAKKVILTVPSTVVRKLDDPKTLMEFWDRVLDCDAELAGRPLERERPERYATDVQISAGYMHSGYPIMTHMDVAPVIVDKERLTKNAHGGVWGFYHEMGHNHQSPDWTFQGTGEVTCNLFTLYVFDKACGAPPSARERVSGEKRAKMLAKYFDGNGGFEEWKKDPFLALIMYVQLQEAFGWDAYKRVFAEYRDLPAAERPKTDDEKRDQWMVRFSRTVGRNLGPFFEAWRVPTSEKARASIANLPAWMPDGFPPGRR